MLNKDEIVLNLFSKQKHIFQSVAFVSLENISCHLFCLKLFRSPFGSLFAISLTTDEISR